MHVWDVAKAAVVQTIFGPHVCGDAVGVFGRTIVTGSWRDESQVGNQKRLTAKSRTLPPPSFLSRSFVPYNPRVVSLISFWAELTAPNVRTKRQERRRATTDSSRSIRFVGLGHIVSSII